jgi:hypothetical protein
MCLIFYFSFIWPLEYTTKCFVVINWYRRLTSIHELCKALRARGVWILQGLFKLCLFCKPFPNPPYFDWWLNRSDDGQTKKNVHLVWHRRCALTSCIWLHDGDDIETHNSDDIAFLEILLIWLSITFCKPRRLGLQKVMTSH